MILAKRLTPILNVSDIKQSFEWFEKLGIAPIKASRDRV